MNLRMENSPEGKHYFLDHPGGSVGISEATANRIHDRLTQIDSAQAALDDEVAAVMASAPSESSK